MLQTMCNCELCDIILKLISWLNLLPINKAFLTAVRENMGFGIWHAVSCFCHSIAVWPKASYLTSLYISSINEDNFYVL